MGDRELDGRLAGSETARTGYHSFVGDVSDRANGPGAHTMRGSTAAELVAELGLLDRGDGGPNRELDTTTAAVLLELRERHPGLELAFRIEDAMRFTRDDCSIDEEEGAGRPALSARLSTLLEAAAPERAEEALLEAARPQPDASIEARLEAIAAFEQAAEPRVRMWLALVRAQSLARGSVTFRERCVRADGRLAWCASGWIRALILFTLGEAQTALALLHPDVDGVFSGGPARPPVHSGPFRTSARDPSEGRPDVVDGRRRPATLEPAVLRRRIERAARASMLFDRSALADALRSVDRRSRDDERWIAHRLLFGDIAAAAEAATRNRPGLAPVRCASLVLDSLVRLSDVGPETLDTDVRWVSGNLKELSEVMASHYRLRGTPGTLVTESISGVAARGFTDQMAGLVASLSKEIAATRDRIRWDRPGAWCDDYVLAVACAEDPSARWSVRLLLGRDREKRERQRQQRALAARLESIGLSPPSENDAGQARAIVRALEAHPIASVFYSIPSIQTILRSLRVESGDGFASSVGGAREAASFLEQWARAAVGAFGALPPPGQVLELCVERHLFGTAALDPEPPMFHTDR